MRIYFANASRCLKLICSSLETLADFSSCLLVHKSPFDISTIPCINTFRSFEPSLKSSSDAHPAEMDTHTLRLITGHPRNGSEGSTSTIRSLLPVGSCEAHRTRIGPGYAEPVTGRSKVDHREVGISQLNGFRNLDKLLERTTLQDIEMMPLFPSCEPCENPIRIRKLGIKSNRLQRNMYESGYSFGKLPLISLADEKCRVHVRTRRITFKPGTLLRDNFQSGFIYDTSLLACLAGQTRGYSVRNGKGFNPSAVLKQRVPVLGAVCHENSQHEEEKPLPRQPIQRVFLWKSWQSVPLDLSSKGEKEQNIVKTPTTFRELSNKDVKTTSLSIQTRFDTRHHRSLQTAYPMESFSHLWATRYALILEEKSVIKPWGEFSEATWQSLITHGMDSEAILQVWWKFPVGERGDVWREFMLWALRHSPERALKVLDVTISDGVPEIPTYALRDCLDHLAAFYLRELKSWDSIKLDRILRLTCKFIEVYAFGRRPYILIDESTICFLLTRCENDQARNLWDTLVRYHFPLGRKTLFRFLAKFAKMADISRFLEVLNRAVRKGMWIDSSHLQQRCARLLCLSFNSESQFADRVLLWDRILQIGIRPSIKMYNAMIRNYVEAQQYDAALSLYKHARDQKVAPNILTYHYLLEVFKRESKFDFLDLVVRDAEADGALLASDFLVDNLLMASMQLGFPELLRLYGRYYDPAPLYDFGLVELGRFLFEPVTLSRPPPSRAVAVLLMAYINFDPLSNKVVDLYDRYCILFYEGHSHARAMASTRYVSNAFIAAFGRRSETVKLCTVVIRAMLCPAPPPRRHSLGPAIKAVEVLPPDVITWTLLLQAFCRHSQMMAAEKVIIMMRERGVEPNERTWSILIYGYAKAQDIDGAMDAVKEMMAAGFPVSDYILSALSMYQGREELLNRLDDALTVDSKPENAIYDVLKEESEKQVQGAY